MNVSRINYSAPSFGKVFLKDEDPGTVAVMDKNRRYTLQGKKVPFPEDDLYAEAEILGPFTEDRDCHVFLSFRDKKDEGIDDEFIVKAELFDKYDEECFDVVEFDSSAYKKDTGDKLGFFFSVRTKLTDCIRKFRFEI